jgi:two-component system nitrogen regulation response regulator GlnG/two-component system response regulator HydG
VITLRQAEREHILRAMILCRGNVELAAERLGITRKTLYRRLAEYRRAG